MQTFQSQAVLLAAIGAVILSGCGGRSGTGESDGVGVGGTAASICASGDTRDCTGPGACHGGQQCGNDGVWGTCDCGPTGGTSSMDATGGALSSGGQYSTVPNLTGGQTSAPTGGSRPTGGRSTGGSSGYGGVGGVGGTTSRPTGGFGGIAGTGLAGGSGGLGGTSVRGGSVGVGGTSLRPTGGFGGVAGTGFAGGVGGIGGFPVGGYGVGGSRPTGGAATGGMTNRPPQITGLAFYPNPVATNDTLYVSVYANDPDYDKITYSYAWACNGKPVGSNSSQLSGYVYFSKGDSITVTVTPSDGKVTGDPATTQPIIVADSPPQFYTWSTISPAPYANDDTTLTCSAAATDADGDSITYTYYWYHSGAPTTYSSATLPNTATTMGDYWSCEVFASDGTANASGGISQETSIASTVSGIYRTDTVWQASKSPYILTGRIQIAAGVTLKIEPGVTVHGNGYSMESWGSIQAAGTADKPIYVDNLYTYDNSTPDKPGKFTFSYVEYVGGLLLASAYSAQVTLSDCVLRYLEGSVYLGTSDTAHVLERNLFFETGGVYANGPLTLNSNTFTYTTLGYYDVQALASVSGSANNFLWEGEVVAVAGNGEVDLRNCYWGGLKDAEIPDQILDNNDDLTILGTITYLPTLKDPSPTAPSVDKTYFP